MNSSDTLIGIDFGSHSVVVSCALSSAALPSWDSSSLGVDVEVLADELGLRSVPSVVAFRGSDEVILGHAAIQQRSKNAVNTFVDIRSFLCDGVVDKESGEVKHSVYVPALDKEISTIELAAHFFKHIVSQLKQRSSISSKIVYDCAVSLPSRFVQYDPHSTAAQGRIREAAKTAGLRIRGFCSDGIGCLLASGFDRPSAPIFLEKGTATVATIDVGWSSTQISIYSISSGFISPLVESRDSSFSISSMVLKLVEFCTKDFQRRYKLDCSESARAILRLRAECENCLKILSSSQETTIVLDSLFEGVDYSVKISRSRVEDLCGVLCMSFKTRVADALACAEVSPGLLDHLLIIGGGGAVPAVQHPIRTLCSNASTDILRKVRIDPSEAVAVGACMYCIQLVQTDESAKIPEDSKLNHLLSPISASITSDANKLLKEFTIFEKNCIVPAKKAISINEFLMSDSGKPGCAVRIESAGLVLASAKLRADVSFEGALLVFALAEVEGCPPQLVVSACDVKSVELEILKIPLM